MSAVEWVLRDDALSIADDGGLRLRVGLPWMRSLPLSCVVALELTMDGVPVPEADVRVCLGAELVTVDELAQRDSWWFLQDRLVLALPEPAVALGGVAPAVVPDSLRSAGSPDPAGSSVSAPGYEVVVAMRLLLPYLNAGPNQPAILPFRAAATLAPAPADRHTVSLDVR